MRDAPLSKIGRMPLEVAWPLPRGAKFEAAAAEMAPHKVDLMAPGASSLPAVTSWIGILTDDTRLDVLVMVAGQLLSTLLPAGMSYGITSVPISKLLAHVFLGLAICRLRIVLRWKPSKLPRWAARVFRCLPSFAVKELVRPGSDWEAWARRSIEAPTSGHAMVYALFSHSSLYIGKTDSVRQGRMIGPGMAMRLTEHLRALCRPTTREGRLPRYVSLRRSLGSVSFLPIACLETASRAFALEGLLIRTLKPMANAADEGQRSLVRAQGLRMQVARKPRRRPPPRFRRRDRFASIWDTTEFWSALDTRLAALDTRTPEPGDVHHLRGPFVPMYRAYQTAEFAKSGCVGPVYIYSSGHEALALSYFGGVHSQVWRPPSWDRERWGEYLYKLALLIPKLLQPGAPQMAASKTLNYALRIQGLPPTSVPPLLLHRRVLQRRGALKAIVARILAAHESTCARKWLEAHISFRPARAPRWTDEFNGKRSIASFDTAAGLDLDPVIIGRATHAPSLRAVEAPWRLPQWPRVQSLVATTRSAFRQWARDLRFKPRLRGYTNAVVDRFTQTLEVPPPPAPWSAFERPMMEATKTHRVILQDDRKPGKAWGIDTRDLVFSMLAQLHADRGWVQRPDLRPRHVLVWLRARAVLGLPGFLRRAEFGKKRRGALQKPPGMFPLIKSKCIRNDGVRMCTKPQHSCWRRVLDMSQTPFATGWRTVARAVRGVVDVLCGRELLDMSRAADGLRDTVQKLLPPELNADGSCSCMRCGATMTPQLRVCTFDIDQAFEACRSDAVGPDVVALMRLYEQKTSSSRILVKRGPRCEVRHSSRSYSRSWFCLHPDQIIRAVLASTLLTLSCCAGIVFEMQGMAIGGVMSSACVTIHLFMSEYKRISSLRPGNTEFPFVGASILSAVSWLRYVDDVIAASTVYCSVCIDAFVRSTYAEAISPCGRSDELSSAEALKWIDLDIYVAGFAMMWLPHNPNRKWLHESCKGPRPSAVLVEWPGSMPMGFSVLRGLLLGKLSRARQVAMADPIIVVTLLECILELHRIGYPYPLIRALVHSLPSVSSVQALRKVVRLWAHHRSRAMAGGGASIWGKGGLNGKDRDDRRGDKYKGDRRPPAKTSPKSDKKKKKARSSSSSSSTSSSASREKRLHRARRRVERADPSYRAFLDCQEKEKRAEDLRAEGEALAAAMKSSFESAISGAITSAVAAMPKAPAPPPPHQGTTESGGSSSGGAAPSFPPPHPDTVAKPGELSKMQVRLVNAELGHIVALSSGDKATFTREIENKWSNRDLTKNVQRLFGTLAKDAALPKGKKERIELLFDIVREKL